MLILTRFVGQSFHIYLDNDEVITIKLIDSQLSPYGRLSAIGIDAPRKFNIVRTELLRRRISHPPVDERFIDENELSDEDYLE